jgi:dipeptidyl-peptidase 4
VCNALTIRAAAAFLALWQVAVSGRLALADQLTIDQIYAANPVQGIPPTHFTWSPDGTRFIYTIVSPDTKRPPVIRLHDVRSGADRVLFKARSEARGSRSRPIAQIVWSPDAKHIAYINAGDLCVADASGEHEIVLAKDVDDPQWSPDSTRIAYVRDNDLYVATPATHRSSRITTGGSPTRINGDPDWLLSEELDVSHAYAWSPKGDAIAYLSFDESRVQPFPIQDYLPTHNTVEEQRYPLAGDANPSESLNVVDLRTGRILKLYDGAPRGEYLVSFVWTPDDRGIVQQILDRPQRNVRLELFSRDGGATKTLVRESSDRFVDVQAAPVFLKDRRRFVWLSERSGVQAIELVDLRDGSAHLIGNGEPIAEILRADENGVYATALTPSRRNLSLVKVPFHAGIPRVLTPERGWHDVAMPEKGDAYVDTFSSFSSPPEVTIRRLDSDRRDGLFQTPSLARFDLGTTRALEIPSEWGPLDAELTVPRDFDSNKRYPVIVEAYGGPLPIGTPLPSDDRWQSLYTFLLAQQGFLVFSIDGPASRADRVANEFLFSESMGNIAMAGQLAGLAWLKTQPYVDSSRVGMMGWSYGGYLTAFTLTHAPGLFRSGIAGAPPADWRYYDTAYTERYMGTPKGQAAAYERTSILPAVSRLQSRLLIMQGSSDDNVHLMNSISLLEAFINAGKQVDYFLYPGARHGVTGVAALRNLYTRMLRWWKETL